MAFHVLVPKKDEACVGEIDRGLKNKWNFRWLEEEIKVEKLGIAVRVGDTIGKINKPGQAACSLCSSVIRQGSQFPADLRNFFTSSSSAKFSVV